MAAWCNGGRWACPDWNEDGTVNLQDYSSFAVKYSLHTASDGREHVYGPDYVDEFAARLDRAIGDITSARDAFCRRSQSGRCES